MFVFDVLDENGSSYHHFIVVGNHIVTFAKLCTKVLIVFLFLFIFIYLICQM